MGKLDGTWVLFDLDGTLTRSEEGIWNCVKYAADRMGFPVTTPIRAPAFRRARSMLRTPG